MTIFDPYIHLWNPRTTPREATPLVKLLGWSPWLLDKATRALMPKPIVDFAGNADYVLLNHLPDIFHQDTGKYEVEGYVHIQAGWHTKKPLGAAGETAWLETLNPKPDGIVGYVNLSDGKNIEAVIQAHRTASSCFKGVRDMVACHPSKGVHNWHDNSNVMQTEAFQKGYAVKGSSIPKQSFQNAAQKLDNEKHPPILLSQSFCQ